METENSGIIEATCTPPPIAEISSQFIIREELDSHGFCQLVIASKDGKWYVLKGLKPNFRNIALYQQLIRKEYDILRSLQHPHIVQCHGETDVAGLGHCIVMEYIEGQSLREFMQEGKLDTQQILRIARQLADAIQYIHTLQIVHRDLKPENILITSNGQHVKLIDFGFSDADSYHILKQPAGTRHYMAPEMMSKDAVSDMRADIFSFGKILAEMLAIPKTNKNRWGLQGRLQKIADKCLLPIDQRMAHADELTQALNESSHHSGKWVPALAFAGLLLVILQLCYLLSANNDQTLLVPGTSFTQADADSISINWTNEQRNKFILALQSFEKERTSGSLSQQISEDMEARERFVLAFTPDSILRLSYNDYSLDNAQSFCRRLRDEMPTLGNIQRMTAEVVFGSFDKAKCRDIAMFLSDAHTGKWQYNSYSLSTPLRDRLLAVYFPYQQLPMIDDKQIDFIVQSLLPTFSERLSLCPESNDDSKSLLIALRKKYASFSQWSLTEYAWFLTHYYPLSDTITQ